MILDNDSEEHSEYLDGGRLGNIKVPKSTTMNTNCCEKCIDGSIEIPSLGASCKFPSCPCHQSAEKDWTKYCTCLAFVKNGFCHHTGYLTTTDTAEKKPCQKVGHYHPEYICDYLSKPTTDTSDWSNRLSKIIKEQETFPSAWGTFYSEVKAFIEKELERTTEECSKLAVQQEQRYYDAGKSEAFSLVREAITDYKNTDMILTMEEYLLNRLSTLEGK